MGLPLYLNYLHATIHAQNKQERNKKTMRPLRHKKYKRIYYYIIVYCSAVKRRIYKVGNFVMLFSVWFFMLSRNQGSAERVKICNIVFFSRRMVYFALFLAVVELMLKFVCRNVYHWRNLYCSQTHADSKFFLIFLFGKCIPSSSDNFIVQFDFLTKE